MTVMNGSGTATKLNIRTGRPRADSLFLGVNFWLREPNRVTAEWVME